MNWERGARKCPESTLAFFEPERELGSESLHFLSLSMNRRRILVADRKRAGVFSEPERESPSHYRGGSKTRRGIF